METERMESEGLLTEQRPAPVPYIFFNDPGHAWLQVKLEELGILGIADKISYFSYRKGLYAYLEEDCDAGIFLRAKYGKDITGAELERRGLIIDKHQDPTPIRNYARYKYSN